MKISLGQKVMAYLLDVDKEKIKVQVEIAIEIEHLIDATNRADFYEMRKSTRHIREYGKLIDKLEAVR